MRSTTRRPISRPTWSPISPAPRSRRRGPTACAWRAPSGEPRPQQLKVTVGFDGGFLAEAGVSYAGPNAAARAGLAREIVQERMRKLHGYQGQAAAGSHRAELAAQHRRGQAVAEPGPAAARRAALHPAGGRRYAAVGIESLLACGPAGGGGYRGQITPQRGHLFGLARSFGSRSFHDAAHRMKKLVTVQQIAHARAGDKGNTSSICVWAYEPATTRRSRRS